MKIIFLLTFFFFITTLTFSQPRPSGNCSITINEYQHTANKIFHFSNGKTIALYGYSEVVNGETIFSEFVFYECGQKEIIREWGAVQSCTITQYDDTLIVKEFYTIANGKGLSLQSIKFYTTKFFWKGNKLKDTSYYEQDLKRYNTSEIQQALREFEQLKKTYNSDETLLVAYRLFWAYVSGSKKAEEYLNEVESKFGPFDGAISEDFHDLILTYEDYKRRIR